MAQVKHFAVYNQEANSNTSADDSGTVSDKALQEIYLHAWDQIVEAGPTRSCVRTPPSTAAPPARTNSCSTGTWTVPSTSRASSAPTTTRPTRPGPAVDAGARSGAAAPPVLRPEAGRRGPVRTGEAVHDRPGSVSASSPRCTVSSCSPRTRPDRSTTTWRRLPMLGSPDGAGVEGTTLLKNADRTLPFAAAGPGSVYAVIGPAAAADPVPAGGGSATVIAAATVTPVAGVAPQAGPRRPPLTYTPGLPTAGESRPSPPRI